MTRRHFLAAGGAAAALGCSGRPPPPIPVRIGQQPLKLGSDRDGVLFVPKGYKPDVADAAGADVPRRRRHRPRRQLHLRCRRRSRRHRAGARLARRSDLGLPAARLRRQTWSSSAPRCKDTYARCNVDRTRMAIAGHSDGASYALSLGLGTGDTFGQIMAFSPGVMQPAEVHGKPKIFISHGLSDPIMPIDVDQPEVRAAAEVARLRRDVPRIRGTARRTRRRSCAKGSSGSLLLERRIRRIPPRAREPTDRKLR